MKTFILTIAILCCGVLSAAQVSLSSSNEMESRATYDAIMEKLYKEREMPLNELILKAAMLRQGTEYVASTLEVEPERLIVDLNHTDCILFVESSLAMAQIARSADTSYNAFCRRIQELRYRNGIVDGYSSRIHYTSEWIQQAQNNGFVKEVSGEIASTPLNQSFSFMSTNSSKYRQLASSPEEVKKIAAIEKRLNGKEYFYIPKEKLSAYASKIKTGDIICFCTSVKGLDIAHVALAVWVDGELTFIHASMGAMKVIIEPRTMQEYLNSVKSLSGIRVIRAQDENILSLNKTLSVSDCYINKQSLTDTAHKTNDMEQFKLMTLPYSTDALEPVISKNTIEFHYGKHLNGYVNTLNTLVEGTEYKGKCIEEIIKSATGPIFNNAGQILNHNLYFSQFSPNGAREPKGALAQAIAKQWGSFDEFKKAFVKGGVTLFGSGWVWLASDKNGELSIMQASNADNPITKGLVPLLCFDVWEHAYYLDYQNRRADHLEALWGIVNWTVVEARYAGR